MTIQGRALILTLVLFLVPSPPAAIQAGADTLTVSDCGDTGAQGQLRQVIAAAKAGDTIDVPACTITLANPADPLTVTESLTINGAGAGRTVIDGAHITGILLVSGAALSVTLTGVTLQHANGAGLNPFAGAVQVSTGASMTLVSSEVTANRGLGGGGLLANTLGTLTLIDSLVSGNQSMCTGGVHNEATLVMVRSTVSGNRSTNNCNAGGISARGPTTLINTTVSGNDGGGATGGIELTIDGTLSVTNSTITGNTGFIGISIETGSTATMRNTIVANNGAGNCAGGAVTSGGHNLDSENSCDFTAVGDLVNTDPQLLPLANHGGPTRTHALLPTSPAIDAGDAASCPATDQRGVPRPLDGDADGTVACDIGAVERILVDAGLALALALNQSVFAPGQTLLADVTLANPTGPAVPADVYAGLFLPPALAPGLGCAPGALAAAFFTPGFADVALHCLSDPPSAFPRVLQATLIPAAFPSTLFPGALVLPLAGAPPGGYELFLGFTVPNALVDDEVGPEDVIRGATAPFTIP